MTINRDGLHRELIENTQRNLRMLLKFEELEDEEKNGVLYGLSCLRKKYIDQEFEISSDCAIQSAFKKYVYPAIRIAIEQLVKEKREAVIDPQLEEFILPMEKEAKDKFAQMSPEDKNHLIGELAIISHKIRNLRVEIRYLRRWLIQPGCLFTDELEPI